MQLIRVFPVALLAATLFAGSVLLVPSRSDQAKYLLNDGDAQEALRVGRAAYEERATDERAARVLAQIETHLGLIEAAGDTLRRRVQSFPDSDSARRDLGRHYLSTGRPGEAVDLFLMIPPKVLTPDERLFTAGHLRASRNALREQHFLGGLWSKGLLEPENARRYADLLVIEGRTEEGLRVFRALDSEVGGLDTDSRLKFFSALHQTGWAAEAAERSANWLAEQPSSQLASGLEWIDGAFSISSTGE